jgi:hypothetical protein
MPLVSHKIRKSYIAIGPVVSLADTRSWTQLRHCSLTLIGSPCEMTPRKPAMYENILFASIVYRGDQYETARSHSEEILIRSKMHSFLLDMEVHASAYT